jgi:hypothetical protein
VGAVRDIPRRKGDDEDLKIERRAGELRLARFHRTRDSAQRDELIARYLPPATATHPSRSTTCCGWPPSGC